MKTENIDKILGAYKKIEIDTILMQKLNQIPSKTKKNKAILSLLPREFAITIASIVFALYAGFLFSMKINNSENFEITNTHDYLEQISLVSLILD
ncbi:MAG: hypothetical protein FWG98_14390 [Candidatus Cloacimonetes bacterium]|nr:hypothetical protein [Candidatus Cloacimonadota bacterium]